MGKVKDMDTAELRLEQSIEEAKMILQSIKTQDLTNAVKSHIEKSERMLEHVQLSSTINN
jgi:hypothetical protein